MSVAQLPVAVAEGATIDDLFRRATSTDGADKAVITWRYRLARARAREVVAESQLRRLVTLEAAGHPIDPAAIHQVEQELADAAGALAFCQEMSRAPLVAPSVQQRPVQQPKPAEVKR